MLSPAPESAVDRSPSKARRLIGMVALCGCAICIIRLEPWSRIPLHNHNRLLLGQDSGVAAEYPIRLNEPMEFDGLTRDAVCRLRRNAVAQHPSLVAAGYRPSHAVFGQVEDGRPWWGIEGQYFHGSGQRSIEGLSEESRFVLNPFLLVAVDFTGLTPWSPDFEWNHDRIEPEDLRREGFPFYCRPASLVWWPAESRAEVTYDLSAHLERLAPLTKRRMTVRDAWFCLMPGNARDLNLSYLHVSPEAMVNVFRPDLPTQPVQIQHFIHRGGSCRYPGGCNNGSPYQEELDGYQLNALPARLDVLLWREPPDDVGQPADMRFMIRIR